MSDETLNAEEAGQEEPTLSREQAEEQLAQMRREQSISGAIAAGAGGMLIGAVLWALVTVSTEYQIGFMAIGVGFLVGFGVRKFGKGIDPIFGYIGATFALLGCVVGNVFTAYGVVAKMEGISVFDAMSLVNMDMLGELMGAMFSPIDLLFYGIALYQGYKLSFHQVTSE